MREMMIFPLQEVAGEEIWVFPERARESPPASWARLAFERLSGGQK